MIHEVRKGTEDPWGGRGQTESLPREYIIRSLRPPVDPTGSRVIRTVPTPGTRASSRKRAGELL